MKKYKVKIEKYKTLLLKYYVRVYKIDKELGNDEIDSDWFTTMWGVNRFITKTIRNDNPDVENKIINWSKR